MEIKAENRALEANSEGSILAARQLSERPSLTESNITLGSHVRALLVDFDGTTVQTYEAHTRSLKAVFSELIGSDVSYELIEQVFKAPRHAERPPPSEGEVLLTLLDDTCRQLGLTRKPNANPAQLVHMRNLFIRDHVEQLAIAPLDGIQAVLLRAKERGLRSVLCTNSSIDFVMPILDRFSISTSIDRIIASDSMPGMRPKPTPDLYIAALQSLGLEGADAVVLEDSAIGAIAAARAKLPVILKPHPDMIESTCQRLITEAATEFAPNYLTVIGSWTQIQFPS